MSSQGHARQRTASGLLRRPMPSGSLMRIIMTSFSERITVHSTARRGIYMTCQWKFGFGKRGNIRIATGTVMSVRTWLKLPGCKTAGRIKGERISAPLGRIWESRAGCMLRRPYCISQIPTEMHPPGVMAVACGESHVS